MDKLAVSHPLLTLSGGIVIVLLLRRLATKKPKYLPGPTGVPLLGNLFQIPETNSWEVYTRWKDIYGDAMYLTAMGNPIVVLSSYQACVDLLEKRSDIYSDRPSSMMTSQLMGWWQAVTMAPYGDRWRRFRRITAQAMRKGAVEQYWPSQEREVKRFLGSLIAAPEKYLANFRFAAGRALMRSVYGLDLQTADDPIIAIAEEAMALATYAATPGTFLVDFFPFLRYIPSWFPGATFKKFAVKGQMLTRQMADIPFDETKKNIESGNYETSFTSINLANKEDEDIVRWCSGTMYTAGTDTTVASIHAFILAMVRNPEVQKRAQAEIDGLVGTERLPNLSDRDDLPYVNALMKEVMRWQPVSPIALPHRLIKDDVYKGCFIPAGATVLGNAWAITRDPALYPNPEEFNPDRFLPLFDKSIECETPPFDPINYAFGFGRRICGGMNYADTMLFLTMACLLSAFEMKPIKNENGKELVPEVLFNSSIVREAMPFDCSFIPRPHAAAVIAAAQLTL